ncbi:hypothetical protein AZF37_02505 [endosymbiont 'TC1' of Trimyema compressum]|uniref:thioredoxin family protein n=1 Tax=endosymbiont 'TC1' of Trimyema compressum TaxID=243899 RepID=UPI0007F15C14|nr:thioredoxin domain-containing protein [endosymbiont 'TC1' of Trimyema compressum]AMP20194.1 hypothetical protein AZF37_02505 [endosymbiont 'TC1' of Trimyema compressum]
MIKIIGENEFSKEVLDRNNEMVMVVFFATWRGHCQDFSKVLESTNEKLNNELIVYKIDVDKNPELVNSYGVESYPTSFFFKNGEVLEKSVGFMSEGRLADKIKLNS